MTLLTIFIAICILDYLYFKIRYTRPHGPPVWYFFPFVGITPFYLLPRRMFLPLWSWYLENFPDAIICRFFIFPVVFVKNAGVQDVQNSEFCRSRAANGCENLIGYVTTGKPYWFVFDHNAREVDWRSERKTNVLALNVLPKEAKFERTAEVADHFLKVIEDQGGRLWDYEEDLTFAKLQETCNVNIGETFEGNSVREFVRFIRLLARNLPTVYLVCLLPLELLKMLQPLFPKAMRVNVAKRVYAKLTSALLERKMREVDEPTNFIEAVLRIKKPDDALSFIRESGLFNMLASTHTTQHSTMAALTYIALEKRVQQKIHEELDRVVGSAKLTNEHLASLHYLKATLHEGYRMTPPVPGVIRWCTGPARVAGYVLPTHIRVVTYLVSETVDPTKFPDVDEFLPERYIKEDGVFEASRDFNVFSRGRRMCSGPDIAGLSALIYLAKILQHFEIIPERPDAKRPRYEGAPISDSSAIPLHFVRREGAPEIKPIPFDGALTAFFKEIVEKEMAAAC